MYISIHLYLMNLFRYKIKPFLLKKNDICFSNLSLTFYAHEKIIIINSHTINYRIDILR